MSSYHHHLCAPVSCCVCVIQQQQLLVFYDTLKKQQQHALFSTLLMHEVYGRAQFSHNILQSIHTTTKPTTGSNYVISFFL
mmetsp:Transcript_5816/g.8916  ORF Transcript_5816/g.8916 Transcript_5816/m.8916 type:complete len:81 (-) Transcript_5816:105-347(-)